MRKTAIAISLALTSYLGATEMNVLAISGSTRKDSVNKKLISEAAEIVRQMHAKVTVVDLKDYPIPFYDHDLEINEGMPEKAKQLRQLMVKSDIILIASPEYNGSLSAVLKNAIDWFSRSEIGGSSREAFKDKKFIIMTATPGQGGTRVLGHLRSVIENIGGIVSPQTIIVPDAYNAFDDRGHLKSDQVRDEIKSAVSMYILKEPQDS